MAEDREKIDRSAVKRRALIGLGFTKEEEEKLIAGLRKAARAAAEIKARQQPLAPRGKTESGGGIQIKNTQAFAENLDRRRKKKR